MSNIAISYARYSSINQNDNSIRRQVEMAEAYADANGLVIDPRFRFTDQGISAWDQSNIEKGAAGLLIQAIEKGQVPIGATLILESFDRLSRAKPIDALVVFIRILNAGLNIVTLTDPPKKFSRDTVNDNTFQLFEALIQMNLAHAGSERKSQLLGKSWEQRHTEAKFSQRAMTSNRPLWLDVSGVRKTGLTFRLIPEREALVRRVIEMSLNGIGNSTIVRTLNAEGIEPWTVEDKKLLRKQADRVAKGLPILPAVWELTAVQRMLTTPALYGAIKTKNDLIEGYYPPIITKDEYIYLQAKRAEKATRKSATRKGPAVTNLFGGLVKCGYCSSNMVIGGYTSKRTGETIKAYGCRGARTGQSDCRMFSWLVTEMEDATLFWLTQVDYSQIVGNGPSSNVEDERRLLATMEHELAALDAKVTNGHEAILEGAKGMVALVNKLEAQADEARNAVKKQEEKVAVLTHQEGPGASRMTALVLLFKMLKNTTDPVALRTLREQLASTLAQVVKVVLLYPKGHNANQTKEDRFIDLTFTNGSTRRIEAGEC